MSSIRYFDNGRYEGSLDVNGLKGGYGTYYWNDGERLEAFWSEDKPKSGTYYCNDGVVYKGTVECVGKKIQITGKGTIFYPDKSKYVGEVKNFERNGSGTLYYDDGVIFKGQWVNNSINGQAKAIFPGDKIYEGDFSMVDNNCVIKGKCIDASGYSYYGTFVNYIQTGKGKTYCKNDELLFDGEFKDGQYDGFGTLYYTKDCYYEGEFKANKFCGSGVLHFGKNTLECQFENGRANGKGVQTDYYLNTVTVGVWRDGHLVEVKSKSTLNSSQKTYTITYSNNDKYVGQVANGKPNGYGVYYVNENGCQKTVCGYFVNGKCTGFGTIVDKYSHYCGQIKRLYPNGHGINLYLNSNAVAIGNFKYGELNGYFIHYDYMPGIRIAEGVYRCDHFVGKVSLVFENGQKYVGRINNYIRPHGKGTYYYSDFNYLVGKFKDGVPTGKCLLCEGGQSYNCVYKNGKCISRVQIFSANSDVSE